MVSQRGELIRNIDFRFTAPKVGEKIKPSIKPLCADKLTFSSQTPKKHDQAKDFFLKVMDILLIPIYWFLAFLRKGKSTPASPEAKKTSSLPQHQRGNSLNNRAAVGIKSVDEPEKIMTQYKKVVRPSYLDVTQDIEYLDEQLNKL